MFKLKSLATLPLSAAALSISIAVSAQSYTISNVQFVGLEATPPQTAYNYLPINANEAFTAGEIPQILAALRSSGLFNSVEARQQNGQLVIVVSEANTIGDIEINGANDISRENITALLKDAGIQVGARFNPAAAQQAEQILREAYQSRGKYNVNVSIGTRPMAGSRSALRVNIQEGTTGKIRQINIQGNERYSDGRIKSQMQLREAGFRTLLSNRDIFSSDRLEADQAAITRFYRNNGYIDARVNVENVDISDDKEDITINLRINEGKQYRISAIGFFGNYPVENQSLRELIQIPQDAVYDQREVDQLTTAVADKLGDFGYAQAQIGVEPRRNQAAGTVELAYQIQAGNRVYVRRINFKGNTTTEDEVLRNQMRQLEGSWVSTRDIKASRRRLERLNYFENIAIEPVPVDGSPDQIDLNVTVEESLTSSIRGGIGYGQDAGVIFNFDINQRNFRGTGQNVNVGVSYSEAEKGGDLSITDPYFTKNGVSQTFRIGYTETDPEELNLSRYLADEGNVDLQYGFPLNEEDTLYFGGGVEYFDFTTGSDTPQELLDTLAANGDQYVNYKLNASFTKDTRDTSLFPTEGSLSRIGAEASVPGSDSEYYKAFANHASYFGLGDYAVIKAQANLAYGDGYGDTETLPFYQNYYTGGIGSVRGFKGNSLGPRYSDDSIKGGAFETTASLGLVTPFILAPNNDSLKTELFVDAGNVFEEVDDFDTDQIRYSAGAALQYYSPFGIIALSYAKPLNAEPEDDEENFQFSIGVSY